MRRGAGELARVLERFDVVDVHNFPATWWAAEAARVAGGSLPPMVWSCNEPPRNLYPGLFEGGGPFTLNGGGDVSGLQGARPPVRPGFRLDPVHQRVRGERVQAIYGHPRTACLMLGVPLPPRPDARVLAEREEAHPSVLMVTRLVAAKNGEVVLRAVQQVAEARLRVIGQGPESERLCTLAGTLGIAGPGVDFLGFVDDDDVRSHYRRANVLVYVPTGEPFGLVLVEAAATALGAVASNHGGPAEIVVDGESGALVDPTSPESVADGLRRVYQARKAMGEAALERAHRLYSFEAWLDRFEQALADAHRG